MLKFSYLGFWRKEKKHFLETLENEPEPPFGSLVFTESLQILNRNQVLCSNYLLIKSLKAERSTSQGMKLYCKRRQCKECFINVNTLPPPPL